MSTHSRNEIEIERTNEVETEDEKGELVGSSGWQTEAAKYLTYLTR
jgi:hypothetical protein